MDKKQVIRTLEKIATYLEIKGENSFKVSAYRRAAQALEADQRSLEQIEKPADIKGIGKGTGQVIEELIETNESSLLKSLEEDVPSGLIDLLQLPGLGGKKIAKLFQELHVSDLESLQSVCLSGQVSQLAGFGKKSVEKILEAIESFGKRPERLPLAYMLPIANDIEAYIKESPEVIQYSRAGSLRRLKETLKDLDFVIATHQPDKVSHDLLARIKPKEIIGHGETKMSIVLNDRFQVGVDFRFVDPASYATALHHFTGSKDHNVKMRQLAKQRKESISEYGIFNDDTKHLYQFNTETSFFKHFNINFIPPEVREGKSEIEAAKQTLDLIDYKDIKGDLHMHTTWSDGAHTIREMAESARQKGYQYISITDHSKSLVVANGLDEERLRRQREEINRLNDSYSDFKIFAGVEMDILADGSLDYSDDFLEEMDFVIAAIHSSFSQDRKTVMRRLTNALYNHNVNLIAHPTGRVLGRRKGYDVDIPMLIDIARETGTALELNANPNRLDLAPEWLSMAQQAGVRIAVNTDAHSITMLEDMNLGVSFAKKGWLTSDAIINTWDVKKLQEFIK